MAAKKKVAKVAAKSAPRKAPTSASKGVAVAKKAPGAKPAADGPLFDKILIANRGEIACRVIRTCKRLGIKTVAVYSEADADALHVREADEAVLNGPPPSAQSYLLIDKIVEACKATGAEAVHPGYGFLSEKEAFQKALAEAGIAFIGPDAHAIYAMGDKIESKKLAQAAGVSTVPGYLAAIPNADEAVKIAQKIGYPVMIKASAGGGGKGMRIAYNDAEAHEGFGSATNEAKASFADDRVFIEKYVEEPRHIEIQLIADGHGNCIYLWERECSIQRRHQKVIEEAPSPALDAGQRARMGQAAVELGRAVGYVGAGTVEFIVPADAPDTFFFLEMNTRLQVEHPVTELTCGLDLVREQLRVARGEPLGYDAAPPQRGAAIEVRWCAEDAERDYLPTTGTLLAVDIPPTVRADVGVAAGSEIGIHYDSMLGKLIAHAPTRAEAAQLLGRALDEMWTPGLVSNREHLARILAHPAFLAGELDTHFLERHAGELAARTPGLDQLRVAAVAVTLHGIAARRATTGPGALAAPGWRNVHVADQAVTYLLGDREIQLGYRPAGPEGIAITLGGKTITVSRFGVDGDRVWFVEGTGHRRQVRVATAGTRAWVLAEGLTLALTQVPRFPEPGARVVAGGLVAPMPGKVVKVLVTEGEVVAAGAALVVLEAMKMEHTVRAGEPGTVRAVHVVVGEQVESDRLLAVVTA